MGIGSIQVDIVEHRRHFEIVMTQLNPVALAFAQAHPVILDDFPDYDHIPARAAVSQWKLHNATFRAVIGIAADAFMYLERDMERGIVHPMMYDIEIALYAQKVLANG